MPENETKHPFRKGPDSLMLLGMTAGPEPREAWLDKDDILRHVFVSGATGSGKSNLLLTMAANAISWGSGLLFVDGKGDISIYAQVCALAKRYGREDSVLLLNFLGSRRGENGAAPSGRSNSINPFRSLTHDEMVQLVTGMMEQAGGDGAMWKGRAVAMATAVIGTACWLRDTGRVELTVGRLRQMVSLRGIIDLANAANYPRMPVKVRAAVTSYLRSLPGYQEEKGYKQAQTTLDQHGYLEMQLTRIFTALGDVYEHVFDADTVDLDFEDIVLNRRIVVVLLPCLEKSQEEIEVLGRLVVSLLKNMMGRALVTPVEGAWDKVVNNRRTMSDHPFLVILDEFGQYATPGMDQMAAQGRSLGFGMVFATQEIQSIERHNGRIYHGIMANTLTKIFMKSETTQSYQIQNFFPGEQFESMSHVRHTQSRMDMLRHLINGGYKDDLLERTIGSDVLQLREDYVGNAIDMFRRLDAVKGRPGADGLRALGTGQMVVSRGGDLARVDAFDVTEGLDPVELALSGFVRIDGGTKGHDTPVARLLSATPPEFRFDPTPFDRASRDETGYVKASFAAIAGARTLGVQKEEKVKWKSLA